MITAKKNCGFPLFSDFLMLSFKDWDYFLSHEPSLSQHSIIPAVAKKETEES